jgi:hypothetical protein
MTVSNLTDMFRWSEASALSPEWDLRAEFAARFIRKGLAILDVGCGTMAAKRIFVPSRYVAVDVVARDSRTRVIDLNASPLPEEWIEEVDLVLFLGVLEYLDHPFVPLSACARVGRPVLCSYSASDLGEAQDRRGNGWLTDITLEQFEADVCAIGLKIVRRFIYNVNQALYLLFPSGADQYAILPEGVGQRMKAPRVSPKRTLVVAGFLGRGNCGDEAIFQVIHETFSPDFDIVASVDEHGAYPGFWKWYPYTGSRNIHQGDLGFPFLEPRPAGLLVGGGGLKMSFVADQVLAARTAGVPCAFAGTDVDAMRDLPEPIDGSFVGDYLALFSYVGVRSATSVETARSLGKTVVHGADWALKLVVDQASDLKPTPNSIALTLREFPLAMVSYEYVKEIVELLRGLRRLGRHPFFLPFCSEDERFLSELGLARSAPTERSWWNPRRMKQIVACAGGVISIGRLHPLIFAASTRTPVISLIPTVDASAQEVVMPKIAAMTTELGIASADSVTEIIDRLRAGDVKPSDETLLRVSEARLEGMIAELKALFAGR